MSNELKIISEGNVDTFDRLTLNTEHRLNYDDGDLTAVYPTTATETEYLVAEFEVEGGTVELPDGTAVLSAGGSVLTLVPTEAYDE